MPAEARHSVVLGSKASAGQVAPEPVQVSATSQTPAEARHSVPTVLKVQADVQQEANEPFAEPWSHCSLLAPQVSMTPLPQRLVRVTVTKWPSFDCVRAPVPG